MSYFIFLIDILLNLRTTYFDENYNEIIGGQLLFLNYIKSLNFYIDFVCIIPTSLISEEINDNSG